VLVIVKEKEKVGEGYCSPSKVILTPIKVLNLAEFYCSCGLERKLFR
jgi:hypothetical protein